MGSLAPVITVNVLMLAAMYILASLGFAFIFNMLGVINLAHGALYMTASYITYYLCVHIGLSNWLAMLLSCIILIALGILLERFCYRPFYIMYMFIGGEKNFLGPLIGTIIFVLLPEIGRGIGAYAPYLSAAALLLVAYLFHGGITGIPAIIRERRERRSAGPVTRVRADK